MEGERYVCATTKQSHNFKLSLNISANKLGEKCEYDSDCDVAFSFCRGQQVCECKRGFEQGPTKDRCVASKLKNNL